jgi:hypothetical protein
VGPMLGVLCRRRCLKSRRGSSEGIIGHGASYGGRGHGDCESRAADETQNGIEGRVCMRGVVQLYMSRSNVGRC